MPVMLSGALGVQRKDVPMRAGTNDRRVPTMVAPVKAADDRYIHLVAAILHRAVEDAQGRVVHTGSRTPVQIEVEARAWLADARNVEALVALCGFDAEPVVRCLRALLAS
jgi:hypothetical protein